jgi:hypothetical protein
MSSQSNFINYIIVLGTTYSGSGAVYDYLSGRGDLYDPLQGTEYQLPQMPNGLMTLEAVAKDAFHPGTADFVLDQFEKLTKKLSRSETLFRYGKDYSSKIPSFEREIKNFIDEICAVKLPMRLHWHRSMHSQSAILYFIYKLKNYLGFNQSIPHTRLLVSSKNLIDAAQKLHNKLFQANSNKRPILLNQAGSGWNPIGSTKYFLNRKVVLVTRDPRDQFAELKKIRKTISAEGFINWYKEMQLRLKEINNSNILRLCFEDFVIKNEKMVNLLCDHISLSSNIISSYEPNLSKKNIGKYQKILSRKEIDIIENRLSEFIYVK